MNEFQLDSDLHDRVKAIRESVRQLFEQLRLKHQDGDISGKERLERVPAFAKHNFANLAGDKPHLAAKEAWRLVDFLEGSNEARLSLRARDGLRVVELDRKLAALRESDPWKEAAAHLREQLGAGHDCGTASPQVPDAAAIGGDSATIQAAEISEPPGRDPETDSVAGDPPFRSPKRWVTLTGIVALAALVLVLLVGDWRLQPPADPRYDCIAIEGASQSMLAQHWATWPGTPLERPPQKGGQEQRITISDPPVGRVQSTWTTSQYSYAERKSPPKPGGGRSDYRLRVGGWGDTYLSLLRIPVPDDRLAHRAVVQLTVIGDEVGSQPTSMTLRAISDDWNVEPGTKHPLWWRECPRSEAIANRLPPPGPRGSVYEIDITDLYNMWAAGLRQPHGIILEPERIGRWAPEGPRYPHFSTFYSTRARDAANRPRLVITY